MIARAATLDLAHLLSLQRQQMGEHRNWRWRWDLNPRRSCPLTRFRGVLLRPLGHATAVEGTGAPFRHAGADSRRAVSDEEITKQGAAFLGKHPALYFGPVVEPTVPHEVPQRAYGPGLGIGRSEDEPG